MLAKLIAISMQQRLIVIIMALCLTVAGLFAVRDLSVDAFPDVTNVQVVVAANVPGRSPEEVERFVTVPLEIAMTGLPGLTEMRSVNRNALSQITLVFTDETDVYFARQQVLERMIEARDRLPADITPILGPVASGLGEVYQYRLVRNDDGDRALSKEELTQRRTIQDWMVRPMLRNIEGVAEIVSLGGYERQYQIRVNPDRLHHYDISLRAVYEALALNNANSGGGKLPHYEEQYLIRSIGLIRDARDIEDIVLREADGIPVYIRDIASVSIGAEVRYGAVISNGVSEAVSGIVIMRRGENAKRVVSLIKARVEDINQRGLLPDQLQIIPYYDRSELVDAAIHTVTKVLEEGVILVIAVLFLYLGDIRSSLIVVVTLIVAPLVTFIVMNHYGISANLMSLGGIAIAIGMMVDGSVVVVENAYHHLGRSQNPENRRLRIERAAKEVATPVVFGVGIICLVFLPLMTLTGIEGKLFSPLAYTIALALAASLVISLTLSPVLCSYFLKGGDDSDTRIVAWMKRHYLPALDLCLSRPVMVCGSSIVVMLLSLCLIPLLGTSFIPEMQEGSIVTGINRVPNMSLAESISLETEAMKRIMKVPGVAGVVSQLGRADNPTDVQAENESTPIVSLLPRDRMPEGWDQAKITEELRKVLAPIPGVQIVMAQPISDRVDEMITGVRSDLAIKIFGDEIDVLKNLADRIVEVVNSVQGASDIRVERLSGQRYLTIEPDRHDLARHGINIADINDILEIALAGKTATTVYEGEKRFSASVRYDEAFRASADAIGHTMLKSQGGAMLHLEDVATIREAEGPAQISREMARRRLVIGVNVQGRDLGGFVSEMQQKIGQQVSLPPGYYLSWGGQFENLERAMHHLQIIIPVTLAAIFFMLFLLFSSLRFASMILLILPFASMGGIYSLFISGEYLSVPASVGFITLWGIAVLNGVVLVTCIRSLHREHHSLANAIRQGCQQRFRPVMMTATVAMLGLIPFLFATGPGSEVQRPLAVVVIGGLVTSTLMTLLVLPCIYQWWFSRYDDEEA